MRVTFGTNGFGIGRNAHNRMRNHCENVVKDDDVHVLTILTSAAVEILLLMPLGLKSPISVTIHYSIPLPFHRCRKYYVSVCVFCSTFAIM